MVLKKQSRRSERAQSIGNLEKLGRRYRHLFLKLSTLIKLPKLPNKLASSRHYPICRQKVVDATLGKKNADGLYYGVLPIGIFFC